MSGEDSSWRDGTQWTNGSSVRASTTSIAENDILKALSGVVVVDLIIGQGSSGAGVPGKSTVSVLRRLRGCIGAAEERPRNGQLAVRLPEVSGVIAKIRTVAPAQADLTLSNRLVSKRLNNALCVGLTDELDNAA
jgi:hypothetical protein